MAESKKDEGNELYKTKNYREALQRYSEAIGESLIHVHVIGFDVLLRNLDIICQFPRWKC